MQKAQKSEKSIMIYVKNYKTEAFLVRILVWKRKKDLKEPWGTFFRDGPGKPISRRK